jgi:carbohydrate-binding DOMON domain-containing protein
MALTRRVQDRVSLVIIGIVITLVIVVAFTVDSVFSTSCYKCQSIEESNECYNRTRYQKMIRDCPWDEVCAKIEGQTKSGQRILIRDCYKPYYGKKTENYRHSCLSYYGTSVDGWISLCPDDYCNHASPISAKVVTIKTTMTLIILQTLKRKVLSD